MKKLYVPEIPFTITFKTIAKKYVSSVGCYIGTILAAEYYWDGLRSKDDPLIYKVTSSLPSIKRDLGNFATEVECEERCIGVVNAFYKLLKSNFKEEKKDESN
jgi:hypothetical protein